MTGPSRSMEEGEGLQAGRGQAGCPDQRKDHDPIQDQTRRSSLMGLLSGQGNVEDF